MAKVVVGSFTKETSGAANATQTISGLAFQPKAIIMWCSKQTATGFAAQQRVSVGVATKIAAGENFCAAFASDDNVGTSNCVRRFSQKILCILTDGAGTPVVLGEISAINSDGFTIKYTTNNTTAYIIHYMALGGSDLTNARALDYSSPAATGNRDDVGFGFQPDCVLFLGLNNSNFDTDSAGSGFCIGAAESSSKRWAFALTGADAQTMAASFGAVNNQRTDRCLLSLTRAATPAIECSADFVGFVSDGYTLNWLNVLGAAFPRYMALALKGGNFEVGAFNKTTSAAPVDQDVTAPAFQVSGVLLSSMHRAATTTIGGDSEHSLGGAGQAGDEAGIWNEWSDTALNTEANVRISNSKAFHLATGPSTLDSECDVEPVAGGFRCKWSTNQTGLADEICYLAFGDTAVPIIGRVLGKTGYDQATAGGRPGPFGTAIGVPPPPPPVARGAIEGLERFESAAPSRSITTEPKVGLIVAAQPAYQPGASEGLERFEGLRSVDRGIIIREVPIPARPAPWEFLSGQTKELMDTAIRSYMNAMERVEPAAPPTSQYVATLEAQDFKIVRLGVGLPGSLGLVVSAPPPSGPVVPPLGQIVIAEVYRRMR